MNITTTRPTETERCLEDQPTGVPKGVAIYARVSTEEQAERQTIQNQLIACREYCHNHGYQISAEYTDEGVSGSVSFGERPGGKQLLEDAQAGKFSIALILRLDRLSRDVIDALVTHQRLQALKVEVKSLTESFDDSPSGKFAYTVMSGVAQLEKALIGERTIAGKKRKAREGLYVGGHIPLGYMLNSKTRRLEIYEPHAAIVREVFKLYIELGSAWMVAKRLGSIPPFDPDLTQGMVFNRSLFWKRLRNGGPANRNIVRSIIKNDAYLGVLRYGDVFADHAHEPIIDHQSWEVAQEVLATRRKPRGPHNQNWRLLSGLLECGIHKSPMRSGGRYYRCDRLYSLNQEKRACQAVADTILEETISNHVLSCLNFSDFASDVITELEKDMEHRKEANDRIIGEQARLNREIGNLVDNLAHANSPDLVSMVQSSINTRQSRLSELVEQVKPSPGLTSDDVFLVKSFLGSLQPYWDKVPARGRNRLLRVFLGSIEVTSRGRETTCVLRWRSAKPETIFLPLAAWRRWSAQEDSWLKEHWVTSTPEGILSGLPGRGWKRIRERAHHLVIPRRRNSLKGLEGSLPK